METPAIRYARTDDGVDIGYAMVGEGRPTVIAERVLHAGLDIFDAVSAIATAFLFFAGFGITETSHHEERLESLEVLLCPAIERMVMALGTVKSQAKKRIGRLQDHRVGIAAFDVAPIQLVRSPPRVEAVVVVVVPAGRFVQERFGFG